jgi:hypothetical protein
MWALSNSGRFDLLYLFVMIPAAWTAKWHRFFMLVRPCSPRRRRLAILDPMAPNRLGNGRMSTSAPAPQQKRSQEHPVEDAIVDAICSTARTAFKLTRGAVKIVAPVAGKVAVAAGAPAARIVGKVAVRAGTPAVQWLVKPPAEPVGFFRTAGKMIYLVMRIFG